jgi:quercetin dioxygenase-like cupin family protein
MSAQGEGWSTAGLDELGEGPGFRKVRKELGVEAFGVNAIVIPPGYETPFHFHDTQDELYFVHVGQIAMTFGDDSVAELGPGAFAHVVAATPRKVKNLGDADAVYVVVGGKDGYVGRDGRTPEADADAAQ